MADTSKRSGRLVAKGQAKAESNESKFACLRRSKRLAVQEKQISYAEEEEEEEEVEPPNLLDALPNELYCKVMDNLELWQQFIVRRVCYSWKEKFDAIILITKECLMVNVKKRKMVKQTNDGARSWRSWAPIESIRRMQFEFVYKKPEISLAQVAQITLDERAFNSDTFTYLGRIFSHISTLIIYWDVDDSDYNIYSLLVLLSQYFSSESNVLTNFGLILSGKINNSGTLQKICSEINTRVASLEQLHLMVPDRYERGDQGGSNLVARVVQLKKASKCNTNFSLTGIVNNSCTLLQNVGYKPKNDESAEKDENARDVRRPQLESLSFSLYFYDEEVIEKNNFIAALDSNKDKFATVQRLVLVNIVQLEFLQRVLKYFPNVEHLFLKFYQSSKQTFDLAWIRALVPLTKLTELFLLNFNFERKSFAWNVPEPIQETVTLEQLRKLTVASPDLILNLRKASNPLGTVCPLIPQLKPEDIGHTIGMRFPGLHEINLWSGDGHLHQTDQGDWKTIEQNISRDLPLSLPQLPGLRVNIQLRHPLLYNKYLALPDDVKANYIRQIVVSNAGYYMGGNIAAVKEMIERRLQPSNRFYPNQNGFLVARAFDELMHKSNEVIRQVRDGEVLHQVEGLELLREFGDLEELRARVQAIIGNLENHI